jgi:hypothetical protein
MHEIHPLALYLPPLTDNEFADLEADIVATGKLRRPIVRYENKILSGHHREKICEKTGVAPWYEDFTGTYPEAVALVKSLELTGRIMTASQRGMAIESLRMHAGEVCTKGASTRTRATARRVLKQGTPELCQAVRDGEVAVTDAAEILDLTGTQQNKLLAKVKDGSCNTIKEAVRTKRQGKNKVKPKGRKLGDAFEAPDDDGSYPDDQVDYNGVPIPPPLKDVFGSQVLPVSTEGLRSMVTSLAGLQTWHPWLLHGKLRTDIESILHQLQENMPMAICQGCSGIGCHDCRSCGWLPRWRVDELGYVGETPHTKRAHRRS